MRSFVLTSLWALAAILVCVAAYVSVTPEDPKEQCVPLYAQSGMECCQ